MTHVEYNRFVQSIDGLSPEQMIQLRRELDNKLAAYAISYDAAMTPDEMADQEVQRRLLAAGMLSEIKPPRRNAAAGREFTAIVIEGEPLSETIIRERR